MVIKVSYRSDYLPPMYIDQWQLTFILLSFLSFILPYFFLFPSFLDPSFPFSFSHFSWFIIFLKELYHNLRISYQHIDMGISFCLFFILYFIYNIYCFLILTLNTLMYLSTFSLKFMAYLFFNCYFEII